MKQVKLIITLAVFFGFQATVSAAVTAKGVVPDEYIVKVNAASNIPEVANAIAKQHTAEIKHVYSHALKGFSARIPAARLQAVKSDPRVVSVSKVYYVSAFKKCASPPCGGTTEPPPADVQEIPTGISRINGHLSSTLSGDGTGSVNVNVAVIDSGIKPDHADLNVVGGVNCSSGKAGDYSDGNGHGTHVAGTIGALDNNIGVVGVAPGVKLWAVRVLNNAGSGTTASVICGIDWVTARADTIKVANMSLGGPGPKGDCNDGSMHEAVCNAVTAGVTFVVAAGNDSEDAANSVPSSYDEVITVSALADFDGAPGGLGSPTCRSDVDDTFANFSNFGTGVDIIAPGVCIKSTWKDGGYNTISGTSMASPHVAGAAALFIASNPGATPATVKAMLISMGNYNWNNSDDPDGIQEPLLDVSGL